MANLTIALDQTLLRQARVKAVLQGTTVNAVLREFLTDWVGGEGERTVAVERLRGALDGGEYRSGGVRWDRAELHER